MTWLDRPGAFEEQIDRNPLHYRSKALDRVVGAMKAAERDKCDGNLYDVAPALFAWRQSDPNEFAKRFGDDKYRQLMAEVTEARRRRKCGIPLVVHPASHPSYEPGIWNDNGVIQTSTNCYAYACNDREGHRPAQFDEDGDPVAIYTPQVGHMGVERFGVRGVSGPTGTDQQRRVANEDKRRAIRRGGYGLTGPQVRFQVMQDNFARQAALKPFLLADGEEPVNIPGYYLVALVVAGNDYHWLRQDDSSYWSHKPGIEEVTDLDDADEIIYDPRVAEFYVHPYEFECFYQVPTGGAKTWRLGDQI
jgi:hypothetical protein